MSEELRAELMAFDRRVLDERHDECMACEDGRLCFVRPVVADEFDPIVPTWAAMVLVVGTPGGRRRERRLLYPEAVRGKQDSEGCLDVRVDVAACVLSVFDEDAA